MCSPLVLQSLTTLVPAEHESYPMVFKIPVHLSGLNACQSKLAEAVIGSDHHFRGCAALVCMVERIRS